MILKRGGKGRMLIKKPHPLLRDGVFGKVNPQVMWRNPLVFRQ
jgi:hypothetical protein